MSYVYQIGALEIVLDVTSDMLCGLFSASCTFIFWV